MTDTERALYLALAAAGVFATGYFAARQATTWVLWCWLVRMDRRTR